MAQAGGARPRASPRSACRSIISAAYALLLVATVVIFSGEVSARAGAWAAAVAIVAIAVAGQFLLAPPRIEEGHNVFLPGAALERELPADVYRQHGE